MLIDAVAGFVVGTLFAYISYIVFYDDKSLSKVQLDDYYKSKYEAQYYKEEYHRIHFVLEHINDEDIKKCSNDKYNHFIIKKEENPDWEEIMCFDDLKRMF